ncbi:uncharacterized protein LOC141769900 [Sebastes fasciatus]|uniref:uncharacterized protein LOC141769900 n=1 Tax=Sebastes fasciatus TaxID=394691 RepID=UPI003D9FAB54
MSPKPSQATVRTTMPEYESTQSEAVSLVNKPSAREVARKDSVGIALVVEPTPLDSTCQKQPQTLIPVQKRQTLDRNIVPVLHEPLPSCMTVQCYSVSVTNGVSQSIIQPYPFSTAPANSVNDTLDMSTKACISDTVLNYSDPVSLVRTRPSRFAYSQRDYVGVPLIVETHPSQDQPRRKQTHVGPQEQVQQGFVHSGSREIDQRPSAPANSIKSFLDMSPKPQQQQKQSETAPDALSTEAVSLVRNTATVTMNGSDGVPLIEEQCAHQQGIHALSGVNTTETLHRQISTYHSNEVFSGTRTTYKDTHQQNKPVDFSAKDSLNTTNITCSYTEPEDGQPMNFTNNKVKAEMFERGQTGRQLQTKTIRGIVDLTLDPQNKTTIIGLQDVKDLSFPHVSSLCQSNLYNQQQYMPPPTSKEVREDAAFSQTQKSLQSMEYSTDKQATTPYHPHYRRQSEMGLNSAPMNTSVSSLVPIQGKIQPLQNLAPQAMQDYASATFSLNCAYQQVEYKKPDQLPPNIPQLQTQHSVPQQQYQQPGVEIGWTSSIAGSQPKAPKLQRQDTTVQHDMTFRPKILIKQPTVESYGSIEEYPSNSGTMTSNGEALPPFSTQQLYGSSQPAPTPQSLPTSVIQQAHDRHRTHPSLQSFDVQPLQSSATTDYYTKEPLQLSKQPDPSQCPITVQQFQTQTVSTSTVAPILHVSEVSAVATQPTTKHGPMPVKQVKSSYLNQGSGAEMQGPEVPPTPAERTSVKGLISLYSGSSSQPFVSTKPVAVMPHHTQTVSIPVDHRVQVTPTQTPAPETPVVKIPESLNLSPQVPVVSSSLASSPSELSNNQTELAQAPSLIIESQYKGQSSVSSGVSPQTSPMISPMVSPSNKSPMHGFKSISQDCQQPLETLNASPARETPGSVELSETLSEVTSKAITKEVITDNMALSESGMSQQQNSEETKQTISTESVNVNTGFGEVSTVANIPQEKICHPTSIYIGINYSKVPPVDTEIGPDETKPYIRLPHIFVSAATPEEEKIEHEFKPELPEVSASEDTTLIAVTLPDCKDSLPADIVAQSDIPEDARATEICSTEAFIESEQAKTYSPEHILTKKSSTIDATLSEAEVKAETTEAYEPPLELSSKDITITAPDITPLEVVKPLAAAPKGTETLEELAHRAKSTTSDVVLPEEVQTLEKLSLKEVSSASDAKSPEGVQQLHEKTERDVSLSSPESSPVKPCTEEITASKEESLAVKVDQPEAEQPNEQPGKGLFSMFSGPTATPQQTASQTGLSILGGILPGSSTKDTPGTGLLSMLGGSNAPSSPGSKDPPPLSTSQETQGKGLFSMFGGSSSQPPSGPRGPTVGSVRPRGPPPKEPPGKGLFSMFGSSAPQQPPSPRGHPVESATPRRPSTGSSIFGGILPGSTTNKETPGAGLFSKFGGLSAQSQTGPRIPPPGPTVTQPGSRGSEPPGKGLFSMFGGQNQQESEAHPVASNPPESEGGFKVSSVFSLGGSSDGNKSKTGFGLFGMSFMEETKTEPETIVSEQVKPMDTKDFSKQAKDHLVEAIENVPSEPPSTSLVKVELQVEQACQDGQDSTLDTNNDTTENSVPLTDPHLEMDKIATMQQHLSYDENASVVVEASITDTPNVTGNLLEKETPQIVKLVSEEQSDIQNEYKEIKDTADIKKEVAESETDTFEIKSTGDETAISAIKSPFEKTDDMQMKSVMDYTDKNTSSDMVGVGHGEAVVEGEITIPDVEKQTEEPLKVAGKEQTAVADVEKSTEEPLKKDEEQTAVADVEKSTKEPLKINEEQTAVADVEKSTEEPLKIVDEDRTAVADVGKSTEEPLKIVDEERTAVADVDQLTKEPLEVIGDEQAYIADVEKSTEEATVADSVIAVTEKPTAESVMSAVTTETAVSESEKSIEEDLKSTSDETTKEPIEAKLELAEATKEPAHGLEKPVESNNSVAVVSSSEEEKTVGTNSPEIMTSQAVGPLKDPSLGPASPPPQQQPRPGMARPPCPPGQRMGAPRMGGPRMGGPRMAGPRMAGPRMAGPRQPGPQKPPEPAPFSGFMSMFSTPNAPSKSSAVGGFFSSSPGSLFGSSPAPRQPQQQQQQQQQQQKSSFFGLPSSMATESLTSDLFGIFKGPETTKSEEPPQSGTESESTEKTDTEKTPLSGDGHVKSPEDSEAPEKGLMEEAERTDKTEAEVSSLTESTMKAAFPEKEAGDDEHTGHVVGTGSAVSDKAAPPPAPESKGMFEIPGLTAPKFGSLFSTTPSPATGTTPQPQQTDGGLFSGFKSLSAGIFNDEKPTGKEEPSSMFGMKLGSMFGNSDPPKPESTPQVVTAQPQSESPKPTDEFCEPESEKLSPGSEETGSADASDTEGPTDTSKTGSCDTLAQSPQSGLPSHSVSLAEDMDKPQLKITPWEVDKSETPDTVHADMGTGQPKDLLTKEAVKRLVQFV